MRGLVGTVALFGVALAAGCTASPLGESPHWDADAVGDATNVVATIVQSASTNSRTITVVVYGGASAVRTIGPPTKSQASDDAGPSSLDGTPKTFASGAPEVIGFLADLTAVGDVTAIPFAPCAKSVSFGTTTTIAVHGRSSPDLQCASDPSSAQAALIADCNQLLSEQ